MLSIRATRVGAVGRLCLAACLLAALACATGGETSEAAQEGPQSLVPEEGTTVEGRLRPGDTALYSLSLDEGQYLELHLDRGPEELMAYLYGPGVEPTGSTQDAATWSELAPGVEGQVAWELAQASGSHLLLLKHQGEGPVSYRLAVTTLRPASARDRARQRCDEVFTEAQALNRSGQVERALERFDETLELCREGEYRRGVGSTVHERAFVLVKLGRFEEARQDLEAAFEIWSELGEVDSMAGARVRLAGLERRLANWYLAEEYLDQALELAREGGFPEVEANVLDQYCRIHLDRGQTERALARCQEAAAAWRDIGDPGKEVDSLNNLGLIHRYLGQLDTAREFLLQGMEIVARHPSRGQEASLRNNLALISEAEGELQSAMSEYQTAAEGHQAAGRFGDAGMALHNIAEIHQRLGSLDAALDHFQEALALTERASDRLNRIAVLLSLGDLHQERGDLVQARQVLKEALGLSRRADARPYLTASLVEMGKLKLKDGQPRSAVGLIEEALELCRKTGDRWEETEALGHLAEAYSDLEEEEKALELLRDAAELGEEIGDRTGAADSRYRIARIERRRGNLQVARQAVEEALAVVDGIRTVVGSNDLRTLFTATTRPYHELYIDVLMAQHEVRPEGGHAAEALKASEAARAQSLLEILAEADLEPGPEVPRELLEERATLHERLNAKELERQYLLTEDDADPAALFRAELDLEGLLTKLREVERRIRAASPRYAALTYPQPVSVGEIQRTVLDAETALLEYSLGEEQSFLWFVTDDSFRTYRLPGRRVVEGAARCLHRLITLYGSLPAGESLEPEVADCLGDHLDRFHDLPPGGHPIRVRAHRKRVIEAAFEDVATGLSEILLGGPSRDGLLPTRLAVVSDGALEYVPFSALPHPQDGGRPLVRRHEVVRQPSASVLAFQRSQAAPALDPSGDLAIVADPVYSGNAEGSRASGTDRRTIAEDPAGGPIRRYAQLPFAKKEAELIARFAPDERTFLAMGREASRETVLSGALSGFRYVHFATHGIIDTRFPELSSLVLSQVDNLGNWRPDGSLHLHEIYGLELDATDMVVLSACETALGREVRGEGLVGLTRGFLYAGAERVVASLWQVQDLATARLMEHLYRGLLEEGRPPAEALRHAQLAILDEGGGRHEFPYFWAGFVLQGEWR